MSFRSKLLMAALKRSLRKPAPDRFSLSVENQPNIDFYHAVLVTNTGIDCTISVTKVTRNGIEGKVWEGDRFSSPCSLAEPHLKNCSIKITRYYRSATIVYSSVRNFWYGELTWTTRRHIWSDKVKQKLFNSRTPFRHDRIEILRKLVAIELSRTEGIEYLDDDGTFRPSMTLFQLVYGSRVFRHPSFESEFKQFAWLLKSLKHSGDLTENHDGYKLTHKAITTIAEFEREERRHADNIRLSSFLTVFTLLMMIATCLQVYLSWTLKP